MTQMETAASPPAPLSPGPTPNLQAGHGARLAITTLAIFLNALLLFVVQPMVGKMLLPQLGGTPAAWNTCMVFFQAMLLIGYLYAHLGARWLSPGAQALVHLGVLLLPLLTLPISMTSDAAPPVDSPIAWTLGVLAVGAGLPFVVLSSGAPLLQRWFAASRHVAAKDPYFLYAASNAGSLLALLAYPIIVEPLLTLRMQSLVWAYGYGALALLIGMLAIWTWVGGRAAPASVAPPTPTAGPRPTRVSATRRFAWIGLALLPCSLMLGVTSHITTDIAAVPLLWVLPLALYLLSFILAFSRWERPLAIATSWAWPFFAVIALTLIVINTSQYRGGQVVFHLVAFFVAALMCHARLAELRPSADRLTEYYLLISVGGVLGGLFNGIVAPLAFPAVIEYAIAIVAAGFARAPTWTPDNVRLARVLDFVLPLGLAAAAVALVFAAAQKFTTVTIAVYLIAVLCLWLMVRPVRLGLGLAVVAATHLYLAYIFPGNLVHIERNFYGVKRIIANPDIRQLVHGGTVHGSQLTTPDGSQRPLNYYHREGPCGEIFRVFNTQRPGGSVGAIGLGVGSIAAYATPSQHFTFYEIDPAVVRIAEREEWFSFLDNMRGKYTCVVGDGRLRIADADDGSFAMVLVDAFSSDAIPTHLLTREAMQIYLSKLDERGWLAFHISNQVFDLRPVLADLAADAQLIAYIKADNNPTPEKSASVWVAMSRSEANLGTLHVITGWERLSGNAATAWTDQYSNLATHIRWH